MNTSIDNSRPFALYACLGTEIFLLELTLSNTVLLELF